MLRPTIIAVCSFWLATAHAVEVRPQIIGEMSTAAADANNVNWGSFPVCGGSNNGMLNMEPPAQTGYQTVNGLHISNSKCRGMKAKYLGGSGIKDGFFFGLIVKNVLVEYTGWEVFTLENGIKNGIVRDSTFRHGNKCEQSERKGGTTAGQNNCEPGTGWPQGLNLTRSENANTLFENNDIYYNYGEGASTFVAAGMVIRGNRIGHTWGATSYGNNTRGGCNIFESNIYYGSMNSQDLGNGVGSQTTRQYNAVVATSVEDNVRTGDGTCNFIRNNVFVGSGTALQANLESLAGAEGEDIDVRHYGNTHVEITGREVDVWNGLSGNNFGRFEGYNNILASPTVSQSNDDRCRSQVDNDYNLWSGTNSDSDCGGPNDIYNGDPAFAETDDNAWLNKHQPTPPTFADVALLAASDARGAGLNLTATVCITGTAFDWLDGEMTYPFAPVLATWKNCQAYDAIGTLRPALNIDMGAIQSSP